MIRVAAGILIRDAKFLICQRRADAVFPLRWEFPGGKLDPGETPRRALVRELAEELAIRVDAKDLELIESVRHRYPSGLEVELHFFRVRAFAGEPANRAFEKIVWAEGSRLPSFDFLEADRALLARLAGAGASPVPRPARRRSAAAPIPED